MSPVPIYGAMPSVYPTGAMPAVTASSGETKWLMSAGKSLDNVDVVYVVEDILAQCSLEQRAEIVSLVHEACCKGAAGGYSAPIHAVAARRLPALLATLCLELFAAMVVQQLNDILRTIILLASFLPVISAVSGNAGLQASTNTIRGLGMGVISPTQVWRTMARELGVSVVTGLVCGVAIGVTAGVWADYSTSTMTSSLRFGAVVGFALCCSMILASAMGVVAPFVFEAIGVDPAHTVGPFETSFQDVVGYTIFLLLAKAMLT